MSATDQEEFLRKILKLVERIESKVASMDARTESRFAALESRICEWTREKNAKGELTHQIAEHLSIVGLKETLTFPRNSIKLVWAVLFCLGLAATIYCMYSTTEEYLSTPTATVVELKRPPFYEYPYLVVCAWGWLDVEKAMAKGLSMDAIKYSLAYIDQLNLDDSLQVENARSAFLKFYESNNYTSLLDYYKDVATHLMDMRNETMIPFAESNSSSYYCEGCDDNSPLDIIPVDTTMCYAFSFSSVHSHHYHNLASPLVWIKLQDRTRIILGQSSNFKIYLTPNKNLSQPDFPSIAMEPFTMMTLRTTQQRFISLGDPENPCIASGTPPNYSPDTCIVNCLGEVLKRLFKCYYFTYSTNGSALHPSQYCNYFDKLPRTNITMWDIQNGELPNIIESEEGAACVQQCRYPCDRTTSFSTLHSKLPIRKTIHNMMDKAKEQNLSLIGITLNNVALSQGGVVTYTEVNTFSASTFISNVGGTLGLFVGGTVLTFFQIVMFCINYVLDRNERRKAAKQTHSRTTAITKNTFLDNNQ